MTSLRQSNGMGRLYAISDLHLSHKFNLDAFNQFFAHPTPTTSPASKTYTKQDGLILGGDVTERASDLRHCFSVTTAIFDKVWWVPGNHELYTLPTSKGTTIPNDNSDEHTDKTLRGEAKYTKLISIARSYGVLTPEDEYVAFTYDDSSSSPAVLVCPIFTLYDYSFRPAEIGRSSALAWAAEKDTIATDEMLLHADPYTTRDAWCEALTAKFAIKLARALWCGTKRTEDWHRLFNAKVVVTGHLHVRRTDWRDDTRFEEVSLGYPRQWEGVRALGKGVKELVREVLPGEEGEKGVTVWRRNG
ncbi:hypothetical protein R6Q59_009988 [Mikania micrantha]